MVGAASRLDAEELEDAGCALEPGPASSPGPSGGTWTGGQADEGGGVGATTIDKAHSGHGKPHATKGMFAEIKVQGGGSTTSTTTP